MFKQFKLTITICGFLLLMFSTFNSCIQEETFDKATIETNQVTSVTEATAICGGLISADGGSNVTARGVCWSTSPNPTIENDTTIDAAGTGPFPSLIKGLLPSTTYFVRAYAVNKGGVGYGLQMTFKTKTFSITTTPIALSFVTAISAIGGGNILSDGDSSALTVKARGVCWSTFPSPTIGNFKTIDGVGGGSFTSNIDSLKAFTTYYLRAYVTNRNGTIYGNEVVFTTLSGVVSLETSATTSITAYTAMSGGVISSDGGAAVTRRGVCWGTISAPTLVNGMTANGSGNGNFSSSIIGLNPGTTYYVRSYATNSVGTSYGNEVTFSTQGGVIGLSTTATTLITAYTAISGGTISSDGGAVVTGRGICWSSNSAPTIANSKTLNGGGSGTFTSSITGLTPSTTYFVRSYATNSVGTSYGNVVTFTTKSGVVDLVSNTATSITAFTATIGGTISSDGGATVSARGVCWSNVSAPTIANNRTTNGSGIGTFTSNITGLSPGTTYYARSYATNSVGTSYGNEVSFTTQDGVVNLTTTATSSIAAYFATSGGTILSDGGATVTMRGVCWGTTPEPTIANSKTANGSGNGSYTSSITKLIPNTTYYVRSYATNNIGTSYGNEVSLITLPSSGTVSDIDGNVYNFVAIGTQLWMVENLKTTKYNDGTSIPLISWAWSNLKTAGFCYYDNNYANKNKYGALYNWYAVNTEKLAPDGWHIPSESEWYTLENFLIANGYNWDGSNSTNKLAKSLAATTDWPTQLGDGQIGNDLTKNNTSGFAGLPGGSRTDDGTFVRFGETGYWWSSTEYSSTLAWIRYLTYSNIGLDRYVNFTKSCGFSVRCIRNN
jgi:uncharacterized protein (TIGR02145 family)